MSQYVGKLRCQIAEVPLYMTYIMAIPGKLYEIEGGVGMHLILLICGWWIFNNNFSQILVTIT